MLCDAVLIVKSNRYEMSLEFNQAVQGCLIHQFWQETDPSLKKSASSSFKARPKLPLLTSELSTGG